MNDKPLLSDWGYENDTHVFFWDGVFSNWYPSEFVIRSGGRFLKFNCVEQFMMVEKALMFHDIQAALAIMGSKEPREQKAIGREVRNFVPDEWSEVARDVVYPGIYNKFDQNERLKKVLLATGDKVIVEASPYDKIWGVGLHFMDPLIEDPKNWRGTNWLGEVLMKVRDDLK